MSTPKEYILVTVREPEVNTPEFAVTLLKPAKAENYLVNVAVHQPQRPDVHDAGASVLLEKGISRLRVPICKHGHAPGYLREPLVDTLDWDSDPWYRRLKDEPDVLNCHSVEQQTTWDHMTGEERADWLCGQLWNCRDILPSFVGRKFDLQRNTYAVLVRYLRPLIR